MQQMVLVSSGAQILVTGESGMSKLRSVLILNCTGIPGCLYHQVTSFAVAINIISLSICRCHKSRQPDSRIGGESGQLPIRDLLHCNCDVTDQFIKAVTSTCHTSRAKAYQALPLLTFRLRRSGKEPGNKAIPPLPNKVIHHCSC